MLYVFYDFLYELFSLSLIFMSKVLMDQDILRSFFIFHSDFCCCISSNRPLELYAGLPKLDAMIYTLPRTRR
jgi:hypothetical protein